MDSALVTTFTDLCAISSPSRNERAVADYIVNRLTQMGLTPVEDEAHRITGGDCGNIFVRLEPVTDGDMILLCSHMDTVPPTDEVVPVLNDGYITNERDTILGGDNKAAVAVMLETLERCVRGEISHAGVEVLFTVCEEVGLLGAGAADVASFQSAYGYVFDHANDIGRYVERAPTHLTLTATFAGVSSHSGIAPEAGVNAIAAAAVAISRIETGRIDPETTANIGIISGGTAGNVVPDLCTVNMEARSLDQMKAAATMQDMVAACTQAAAESGCSVDVDVHTEYEGYVIPRSARSRQVAEAALSAAGFTPEPVPCGGGSDANVFNAKGFPCLNLCNAMENIHTPSEGIAVRALTGMLYVTENLLACSRQAQSEV